MSLPVTDRDAIGDVGLRISPAVRRDPGRLMACAGVTRVSDAADAWIPRGSWEPFDARSLPPARAGGPAARSRTIGLLNVAADLLGRLRADAARAQAAGGMAHFAADLCDAVAGEWDVVVRPRSLSLGRNAPGLPTVTRDPVTGQFVGLHVDTFHEEYDAARAAAGNRISVNIGAGPRHFLFIPLSFRMLYLKSGEPAGRADVVTAFLAANPAQPVLRLRVNPGEAYIAPTESIVHDGTSLGATAEDLHVTGRGVLDPRPC